MVTDETNPDSPTAGALRRPIGWWLKEADAQLDAAFDRALDETPVNRRGWQVLSSIARRAGGEADLAEALAAFESPVAVHDILTDFVSRGWVTSVEDELCLTEEGSRQYAAITPLVTQVRQLVGAALPPDDYVELVRLLQRLTDGLRVNDLERPPSTNAR